MDIIAEEVSDNPEYRKDIRQKTIDFGLLVSKALTEDDSVYRLYYDFAEPIKKLANHRLLAINRGEKEGFLSVKLILTKKKSQTIFSDDLLQNTNHRLQNTSNLPPRTVINDLLHRPYQQKYAICLRKMPRRHQ